MCPYLIHRTLQERAGRAADPDPATRSEALADELASLAAEEIERADFAGAEAILKQGLAQNPQHPRCRAYQAICLAALGRGFDRAEETARSVTRDHPRDAGGWFALAEVELLAGRRGPAFQHFAHARSLAGRDRELKGRIDRRDPRRPPVFEGLSRDHWLNRICGRLEFLRRGR